MNDNRELKLEIKNLIMQSLDIQDLDPNEVDDDASLFGDDNPMGLDSIDAISIVVALQKKYDVRIDDQNHSRAILTSINTIAEFIDNERKKQD